MKRLTILLLLALTGSARAQQQPDPAFLQRALVAMQQQRNAAMDAQIVAEAQRAGIAEEIAKLKARIAEMDASVPKKDELPKP